MSKCETCPHLAKCKQRIKNLTPKEKKKLCYKLWKKKVLLKLGEHKTRMKLLSIPLIPFQIVFYFLSIALRKKQMISIINLRLQGIKLQSMMKKIEKRKSHNYVSPERKTKRKKKRNESK